MEEKMHIKDMFLQCPDDICDGSGKVQDAEGEWEDCPHTKDYDQTPENL